MCGLTFCFDSGADEAALRQRTAAALSRLRHRGPDAEGLLSAPGWSMGHRRLAIIDLVGSPQPMWDEERRYCLAYNGELYNYRALRNDLEGQWRFATEGDTEVVLAGLVILGADFLDRMEGMWALALWDATQRRLLLARDRMGKKPLFYRVTAQHMACASELPALKALSPGEWREDLDSTADYLRYGYNLPGHTAYQRVKEVLPGHVLSWTPERGVEEKSYWQLRPMRFAGNRGQVNEQLREVLTRAVERRLVADVEVGAFLSGGVDSTLICAIVRKELGLPLKTFTIGFQDAAFDERRFARIAADALATEHYEDVLGGWDEAELERLVLEHIGQPFADSSLLPTALVSRVAAREVKVALSGDGGDELFSGYQRYQARNILRWYTRLPVGLRHGAEKAVRALPEPMVHHSRSILKKAHLFMDIVARGKGETPYVAPSMFTPEQLIEVAPDLEGCGHTPLSIPETTEPDDIQRMMFADALVYLPQDILVKVDRASMACSLEARAPFLDRELVELAFSLPRQSHRRGMRGKRLLRESFGELLPATLWKRRKQGFGVPIHAWFRGTLGDKLRGLLASDPGPLNPAPILSMLDAHQRVSRDHGSRLWLIYSYLLWRQLESWPELDRINAQRRCKAMPFT